MTTVSDDSSRIRVLVCIPTYRRVDYLPSLLDSLMYVRVWALDVSIVICDNDPEGSALGIRNHSLVASGRVEYRHVGKGGLSAVRNFAVDEATRKQVQFLAFLDDDEIPCEQWLQELLRVQHDYRADVVAGPVVQLDAARADPAVRALLTRASRPEGLFRGDVGAGNVLLNVAFLSRHELRFDEVFNKFGGEDTHFFRLCDKSGALMAWAPLAEAIERNSPDRLRRYSLLRRAVLNGRSSRLVQERLGAGAAVPKRIVEFSIVTPLCLVAGVWCLVRNDQEEFWRQIFRLARQVGRLMGAPRGSEGRAYGVH